MAEDSLFYGLSDGHQGLESLSLHLNIIPQNNISHIVIEFINIGLCICWNFAYLLF